MKKLFISVVVMILFVGFGNKAMAQASSAANTATVNATLATSGVFTNKTPLNFGSFTALPAGGTMAMDAQLSALTNTGVTPISGSVASAATFEISGTANQLVTVALPVSAYSIKRAGGTETMTVTGFNCYPGALGANIDLGVSGKVILSVAGTLNVGLNQVPGSYVSPDGGFTVTANFQ
ncbi:MAG TPA: hypothetical protein DCL77_12585 [Prolixibacteraceae bacterium]|jgi:hypothetical protein|nr:hypothetical protein [Prolixibacteraceae bacterium]